MSDENGRPLGTSWAPHGQILWRTLGPEPATRSVSGHQGPGGGCPVFLQRAAATVRLVAVGGAQTGRSKPQPSSDRLGAKGVGWVNIVNFKGYDDSNQGKHHGPLH
jgi:hypothetical protein